MRDPVTAIIKSLTIAKINLELRHIWRLIAICIAPVPFRMESWHNPWLFYHQHIHQGIQKTLKSKFKKTYSEEF